jgi:hypothetical protein
MLRIPFARTLAARRTALGVTTPKRINTTQIPATSRTISFIPWRKKPDPTLPVYFPKQKPESKNTSQGRRPILRKVRYALITAAVYYTLWQVYMSVVIDPLLDWAENEWDSMSDQERQEMEREAEEGEEDSILFLPFPFTTKEVNQSPYKGSDPEWKAFVKVNKDPKLQKQMRLMLAEVVRKGFEKNPMTIKILGGKSVKVKKIWLDILYPPTPPPKHYVSGLIVDWDGLFWGDRSIDSVFAHQLNAILYPKAVALATWAFVSVLAQRTQANITKALGLGESKQQETSWQSVILERGKEHKPGVFGSGSSTPPQIMRPSSPAGQASPSTSPASSVQLPVTGAAQGQDLLGFVKRPVNTESAPSLSVLMALQAATLTLAQNWTPTQPAINSGCIRVDGLVELLGSSTVVAVYVVGWFDPQTKKYVNVQTRIKHAMPLKQTPLGGN